MKKLQIIVEGSSEETFVNDVMVKHFAQLSIFISARKIRTGWDKLNNKPAKGGLMKYIKFRNDVLRWIESDKGMVNTFYTSFIDLYAFPKDSNSPYTIDIQNIANLNPEEINESPQSAPSKRIIQFLPNYESQKAQVGPMVAEDIGLTLLRKHCPHFNEWITKLENI